MNPIQKQIEDSVSILKEAYTKAYSGILPKEILDKGIPWFESHLLLSQQNLLQAVVEWARGTTGATGVDMRGRRWIDLKDLESLLQSSIKK